MYARKNCKHRRQPVAEYKEFPMPCPNPTLSIFSGSLSNHSYISKYFVLFFNSIKKRMWTIYVEIENLTNKARILFILQKKKIK